MSLHAFARLCKGVVLQMPKQSLGMQGTQSVLLQCQPKTLAACCQLMLACCLVVCSRERAATACITPPLPALSCSHATTHSWKYVSATVMKAVTTMRIMYTMNRMLHMMYTLWPHTLAKM